MEAVTSSRLSLLPGRQVTPSRSALPPAVRIVATAVLVAVAYHLGATVRRAVAIPAGHHLGAVAAERDPHRGPAPDPAPAVVDLPAGGVSRARAGAARRAAPRRSAWPLFVTNCSEALIAAVAVRSLSDAPGRFDTLRRMAAFIIGAVLVAPFVSSFADAAVVAGFKGEPYWLVWRTRFFSNMLTELTLVPAIVVAITHGRRGCGTPRCAAGSRPSGWRVLPFGMWTLVMLAVEHSSAFRASPGVPLALLLPALSWAAVRFGPGGTSVSLLTTVLLVVWSGSHGNAPVLHDPAGRGRAGAADLPHRGGHPAPAAGRGHRRAPARPAGAAGTAALRGAAVAPLGRLRALAGARDGRRVRELAAPARRVPRARSGDALPLLARARRVHRRLRVERARAWPRSRASR